MHRAAHVIYFCLVLIFTSQIQADTDTGATKRQLLETLAAATKEIDGRLAESAVWEFWFDQSPTDEVRANLDKGRERIQAYDYEAAESFLDKVVETAPDYAEGYNQRAYARFLRENYSESLTDLEKTLELEPHHFGAMSGMYHILRIQNRTKAALGMLQQAVTIHPWIQERGGLPKDRWPESYRKIHEPGLEI